MRKVDEYLQYAKELIARAEKGDAEQKYNYALLAAEWEKLAAERLKVIELRVHRNVSETDA